MSQAYYKAITNSPDSLDQESIDLLKTYFLGHSANVRECSKYKETLKNGYSDYTMVPLKRIYVHEKTKKCYDLEYLIEHFTLYPNGPSPYTFPLSTDRVGYNDMKNIAHAALRYNHTVKHYERDSFETENERYRFAFEKGLVYFENNRYNYPRIGQEIIVLNNSMRVLLMLNDLTNKITKPSSIIKEILDFDFRDKNYTFKNHSPAEYFAALMTSYTTLNQVTTDVALNFFQSYFPKIGRDSNLRHEILVLQQIMEKHPIQIPVPVRVSVPVAVTTGSFTLTMDDTYIKRSVDDQKAAKEQMDKYGMKLTTDDKNQIHLCNMNTASLFNNANSFNSIPRRRIYTRMSTQSKKYYCLDLLGCAQSIGHGYYILDETGAVKETLSFDELKTIARLTMTYNTELLKYKHSMDRCIEKGLVYLDENDNTIKIGEPINFPDPFVYLLFLDLSRINPTTLSKIYFKIQNKDDKFEERKEYYVTIKDRNSFGYDLFSFYKDLFSYEAPGSISQDQIATDLVHLHNIFNDQHESTDFQALKTRLTTRPMNYKPKLSYNATLLLNLQKDDKRGSNNVSNGSLTPWQRVFGRKSF